MAVDGWKELEQGVWSLATPTGLEFIIEDISDRSGGRSVFQAIQVLRTCRASQEHLLMRFPTLEQAMSYVERLAAHQQGPGRC
jgi:hypothetical protein